ncbi:hypothetical protein [Cohnella cholangitidis]|uniref:Agarase n=1 Tax=Cohnella cholangitidis TaxID=2598458 RepID=A0A7G5C441_9BACL|nr:hypothetical protein [Cohnella cholangitidis]QMV43975.1 hypothetical protein FPL14_24475 [Cohnella cholangitidis]
MSSEREAFLREYMYTPDFRPQTPYVPSYLEARKAFGNSGSGLSPDPWEWAERMLAELEETEAPTQEYEVFVPNTDTEEYCLNTKAMVREETPFATRSLETIKGYRPPSALLEFDRWGGRIDKFYGATGFFRVVRDEGRFWIVDPDGHPCYHTAISQVSAHTSPNTVKNAVDNFGSVEGWADTATERLRELGFTAVGMWSDESLVHQSKTPIGICGTAYFITTYGDRNGLTKPSVGHKVFAHNNAMPVFDPMFETFAHDYAREVTAELKGKPDVVGWFSDNELPANLNMLERFLTLDPNEACNRYSLAVAWTFLKHESGLDDPKIEDATDDIRERFRGAVYDRYFRVVATALKVADPNHLYLGSRFMFLGPHFMDGTLLGEGMMRAAGRWCDVISVNYYMAWTPDGKEIEKWALWSGKPLIISEWYAMASDSGMANATGAGFRVATQKDRARFYQNFALWLVECPWFVGFHWFKYSDNDPTDANAEASNLNGNKGIVTTQFVEWTDLTDEMMELNGQIYSLIDFFDRRNSVLDTVGNVNL